MPHEPTRFSKKPAAHSRPRAITPSPPNVGVSMAMVQEKYVVGRDHLEPIDQD